jgi:hypothetical protein
MQGRGEFLRRPEKRTRMVSLVDANIVVNVIPPDIDLEKVVYNITSDERLVVTDGSGWQLDVNEFSWHR